MEPRILAFEVAQRTPERSAPVAIQSPSSRMCVLKCSIGTSSTAGHSCMDCKEIREIEASLAAAEELVSDLKRRRTALQSAMITRNDPITGILPPEISTLIFELYIEIHTKENRRFDVPELDEVNAGVPLRLGAVCRRWRAIAWSSPSLWTMLRVDLLSEGHTHGPDLIQQWFERTGCLSVSVRLIKHWRSLDNAWKANAKSVMTVLNRFSSKLFNLDIQGVPFDIASLFRNPTKESPTPTLLRYLCVGDFGDDEDLIESSTTMCLFHRYNPPPSPHSFSLHSSIPPNKINILWSNLIELSLQNVLWDIAFNIIRLGASNILHINLESIKDYEQDASWAPSYSIHLPELLLLSYTNMESSQGVAQALFNTLCFPSLTSLRYYGDDYERIMPIRSMIACIKRSICNLEELRIDGPEIAHIGQIVPFLHEVPTLKTLNLSLGPSLSPEHLLRAMSGRFRHQDEPLLMPALEYLELTAYPTLEWSAFTQIWLGGEPVTNEHGCEIVGIYSERKKLGAHVTLKSDGDEKHFLSPRDVLDVISIIPELDRDSGSISINRTAVGARTMDSGASPLNTPNLVEASYLHHFSTESVPQFLSFYNKAKTVGIF
ncbi:hypothetical protein D9619_012329 [Psilocybe cf. subviscida]|uniref:F-box domain-containing protein n=1 Tax=Psilocybe cf. subviscida TaxID=2480587 RepID=A0A8H5ARW6_9AGAR|nr:hypothetical protein D9619_012329 [Psilocybe cf. subviscida]